MTSPVSDGRREGSLSGRPPRRWAPGLRTRVAGVVVVTTVATLAIAAIGLLGPLEDSLRNNALKTLERDLNPGVTAGFRRLDLTYVADTSSNDSYSLIGHFQRRALGRQQQVVGERFGSTVTLLRFNPRTGQAEAVLNGPDQSDSSDVFDDGTRAFLRHHRVESLHTLDGTEVARIAQPVTIAGHRYVLAVRRPITEVSGAVHVVRKAFIEAALAGLILTGLLTIPLTARLVRRLRRLREAAVALANEGPAAPAVEVPQDRARDEVGDLARTFAIMQSRLQHQEEARRKFVATASHELRTPLTSLEGMLELLEDDVRSGQLDPEDSQALLERARIQSRRLSRLASDLLDLSRIDANVRLRSEPVELAEIGRAVLAEFGMGADQRQVRTVLHNVAQPVWALGDPGSVAQIIRILLDNAMRASPDGGQITVDLEEGGTPALSVSDEGPGVPDDERELIFERFQRGRDTKGQVGFGLGLAIGRELAERMGGELVLEPIEGAGARFTLRLPQARAPEEEPVAVA